MDDKQKINIVESKFLLYNIVLKPTWAYRIDLWGAVSDSNIKILKRFQSKLLRMITSALWLVTNKTIHQDVEIPYVEEVIHDKKKHVYNICSD